MLTRVSLGIVCLTILILATFVCAPPAAAQTLQLGSVSNISGGGAGSCTGFSTQGSPGYRAFDPSMQQCFIAQLNCPNADPLPFIYGYWSPQGAPVGTIVTLTGDGGVYASTEGFSDYYVPEYENANYRVVEVAWGVAVPGISWEIANSSPNSTTTPSIINAACRVATFLHFVKTTPTLWSGGGMCVHADSGGGGGLAYALTWYGEANDLSKVLLENGPVFSRIDLGCDVPNGNSTSVCNPNTLNGCNQNPTTWPTENPPISYPLEYIPNDASNVNLWTGNTGPVCANGQGITTTYTRVGSV
jgi:hypothetical protein